MEAAALQSNRDDKREPVSSGKLTSFSAAVSRSLASSASFYFSRPIRLFRPTKVSAVTAIQALAHERGGFSTAVVRSIWRDEGWKLFPRHILPPFIANTAIGMTLFATYTSSDFVLHAIPQPFPEPLIPFVAGALAGSAQAILSSPLDNVRMLLQRKSDGANFSWASIMREALFPKFLIGTPDAAAKSRFGQLRALTRWSSRGWSLYGLSLTRDALGFGAFFAIFEQGRKWAKRAGNRIDQSLASKTWPKWLTGRTEEEKKSRGWIGRTAQAVILVMGGTLAGSAYGVIGRPFDVARRSIWEARMKWAEQQGLGAAKAPSAAAAQATSASSPSKGGLRGFLGSVFTRQPRVEAKLPALPSARSIVSETIRRQGVRVFFISPTTATGSVTRRLQSHPSLGGPSVYSVGSSRRSSSPNSRIAGVGGAVVRFFSVVQPHSLAFLAYAVASGDLSS